MINQYVGENQTLSWRPKREKKIEKINNLNWRGPFLKKKKVIKIDELEEKKNKRIL